MLRMCVNVCEREGGEREKAYYMFLKFSKLNENVYLKVCTQIK